MRKHRCATVGWLILVLLATSCVPVSHEDPNPGRIAVLGASGKEVARIEKMLVVPERREIEGITFLTGTLGGKPVVVASTGVGKVNAAMTATLLIEHFRPACVLLTGIAGGVDPNLAPGDMVIAERTAHHDMGLLWPEAMEHGGVSNPLTHEDNPTFFVADPRLLTAARQAASQTELDAIGLRTGQRPPRITVGTIVTGDAFVASQDKCAELAETLDADAVEMEGAAVAQLCYQRGVGCLVIRCIADKADESAVLDKQKFYDLAAENSARLIVEVIQCLAD